VAGVRERRHPALVLPARVLPDLIDVQVLQNTVSTRAGSTPARASRSRKPVPRR
jgi:hypothetical protein